MTLLKIKVFQDGWKRKTPGTSRNIRVAEMEKVTQYIEQRFILNLTDFMYMSHPVALMFHVSYVLCDIAAFESTRI